MTEIDQKLQAMLWDAAQKGDTAKIRMLAVEDGVDFDAKNEEGRTPFQLATGYNHPDTAKAILAARQFRYLRALEGATPMPVDVPVRKGNEEAGGFLGLFRRRKTG